jgi:hypothetical protein
MTAPRYGTCALIITEKIQNIERCSDFSLRHLLIKMLIQISENYSNMYTGDILEKACTFQSRN